MFLHWLNRTRIKTQDGLPNYHLIPAPSAGEAMESVYEKEFGDPVYPLLGGPGKLAQNQLLAFQPPQVAQVLSSPVIGVGGIPVPDQTFDLQSLEDLTNG